MGSCISKCRPKKKFKEDCGHVHDKLVISQDPISSIPPSIPSKRHVSPAPSSSSTSSLTSFSCSTNAKCTMASSTSSSSSSSLSSKDRSFSNEFLWSCVKENPHIIGLSRPVISNRNNLEKAISKAHRIPPNNLDPSPLVASPIGSKVMKQSIQERQQMIIVATPKKRARASSPTLVRQKSFRREHNCASSIPNRGLRSPSPSRRFNGDNSRNISAYSKAINGVKREGFRGPSMSPNRDNLMTNRNFAVRKMDRVSQQVSEKIGVGDIKCNQEMDTVMEDINNPLIALDCFIFL